VSSELDAQSAAGSEPVAESEVEPSSGVTAEVELSELDQLGLDDPLTLRSALEAILFISDVPLAAADIAAALGRPEPDVRTALTALGTELDVRAAGIELREIAGGFRLYTRSELAPAVERFLRDGQRTRLTQASLETLAVIAYRQPVTRGRVAAIRAVNVDGVVRTLLSRGLVAEVGTDPDSGAGLYATTDLFLEKLGVGGLDELPSLAPLLPDFADLDSADGLDFDAY
jgi:segregation and condensation protein B